MITLKPIRFVLASALAFLMTVPGSAQDLPRHEVRLGWGDMLFETMAFHPGSRHLYPSGNPNGYKFTETRDYAFTGHIFAEYRYHFTRLFSLGDRQVQMVSDYGTAFAITDSCELHLGEGRRFSLFSADNSLRISSEGLQWPTDEVVFDAWWKATLNRTVAPIVTLRFNHPAPALVIVD
jgi:hypothetical protein